jgi:type VI secretion system protein ImpL
MALAIALSALLAALLALPWLLVLAGAPLWAPLAIDVGVLSSSAALVAIRFALTRAKAKKLEPAVAPRAARDVPAADVAAELDEVRRDVDAAAGTITRSQLGGGGRAAIGALPWYAVIGPPGAGKSTLLRGSGLAFPSAPRELAGHGAHNASTRRVDLWLANEAVLFDTAGRWSVGDGVEWAAFLERVGKHRGGRGLDGVVLALPVDELTGASESERASLARQLRARIEELVRRFGVSVPVYVIVTRCDRLVGFAETFASLDKRARARPWGFSLERTPGDLDETLRTELVDLASALRARTVTTLAAERRVEARALIAELPAHFATIVDPLVSVLTQVFVASVYGETPALRSVHFASATQEGRPCDRLLTPALRASGVEPRAFAELALEPRSYFVHQVFTRVAFADAETAAPSTRAKRRRTVIHVSLAAFVAMSAGLWAIGSAFSWRANRQSIDRFARASPALSPETLVTPEALDALRTMVVELRAHVAHPPLSMRFGLCRVDQIGDAATTRYARAMRTGVLEPLLAREATELETWGATFEADLDREPSPTERSRASVLLERQLRFASPMDQGEPPLDERTSAATAHALAEAWCGALHRRISDCEAHASLLLEVTGRGRPRVDRHTRAIDLARLGLSRSSADRAALDAIVAGVDGRGYDLTLARMVGTTGRALSSDRHVRGAFTRRGWDDIVRARLASPDIDADRAWVLGTRARASTGSGREELTRRYLEAYADEWRSFLSSVRVASPTDATESLALLEDMTRGTPPPLGRLLVAVDDNAHFDQQAASDAAAPETTLLDTLTTQLGGASQTTPETLADLDAHVVASALAPFTHFAVRAPGTPDDAPLGIDVYRDELSLLRDALATYRDDPNAAAPLDTRLVAARRRVDGLVTEQPAGARDFFERVLRPPVEGAALTSARAIAGAVGASFCAAVVTPYARSLAGHYPFAPHGDDAPLGEVTAFYRSSGTVWSYYDASLAGIAPRAGGHFALAHRDHEGGSAYASTLTTFLERSDAVTAGLFPPGSSEPRIELDVRVHPTAGAASVRFSVGGASIDYRNGPETWTRIVWPGATPGAGARLEVESARGLSERLAQEGEWGLFRLLEAATQIESRPGDRTHTARWHLPGHDVDVVIDVRTVRSESVLFDASGRGHVLAPLRAAGLAAPRRIARSGSECSP